jgi:hypothetical protein
MKRKPRSTDPKLLKAHDDAWKALKAHPIDQEIEGLFAVLNELQTWHLDREDFAQHMARYEAGKPQEIFARIKALQVELWKTAESILWFELYAQVNP